MRRSQLVVLIILSMISTLLPVAAVVAANGDNLRTIIADRTGTDCASYDVAGNHASVGVGIAFDGTNLLISCYSDNTIVAIDPADGSQVGINTISGAFSLGALAWDAGRGLLWACSNFSDVGTIDLATDVFTPVFTSQSCFDGLAYDGSDDTLWSSGDVYNHVEHYTTTGTELSSNPVTLGGTGNSGIAVGGANLYLANNGASQIYEVPKDFSSETLFASFPARLEDLECDNLTFAGDGKAAIWSIDAYDNILNAWEIPAGACEFGGGDPGGSEEVNDIADPDSYVCAEPGFIDFEDLPDGHNLSSGAIGGVQFTTTGGFTWLVGDFDTGFYNGKYPSGGYTSKGTHWAWLGVAAGEGRIDFVNGPASSISLLASVNESPLSLEAYDAGDNLLAAAGPSSVNYATGHMDELKITRASADIAYVVVHDSGNFFLVDAICTDAPGVNPPDNTPPTADAGGPYAGDEGAAIAISGAASDGDDDALTTTWSYAPVSGVDAGAACSFADALALATTVSCTDDGAYSLTLTVDDGNGGSATSTTSLTVANVAPSGTITSPADASIVPVNTEVTLTSAFSDPGSNDTHVCDVDWDAGFESGSGGLACTDTHTYTAPGIYTVTARVTDDDGGTGSDSIMLVVYDPTAGFVTGGGWIDSPVGAYADDPDLAGRATFGFVSKYKKGASVPDGSTEFQFQAASFNFHSTAYEWLVVTKASKNAQFKGTGTVNGALDVNGNPYKFMLWATDSSPDTFRIRIWWEAGGVENVVYDNGVEQAIGSGSIVVHTK